MKIVHYQAPTPPVPSKTFPCLVRDPKDGCVMLALKVTADKGYYGIIMSSGSSSIAEGEIDWYNDLCFTESYSGSFTISN